MPRRNLLPASATSCHGAQAVHRLDPQPRDRRHPIRLHDAHPAERAVVEPVVDGQAPAASLAGARCHALAGHEEIVQAARPGQTRFMSRLEQARGVARKLPGVVDGQRLNRGLGAETRPAAEQALKMSGADTARPGKIFESGLMLPVLPETSRISSTSSWPGPRPGGSSG